MRTLALLGLAASVVMVPMAAEAKRDSRGQMAGSHAGNRPMMHRWGPKQNGRWHAGWRAPGGWNAYRRPVRGYVVPRYWIAPSFYIGNWSRYGFGQPSYGLAWSRYYDDAVLIDGNGHVHDSVHGVDWDRYEFGYDVDDRDYSRERRDDGVGGALIGGAIGAIAGNRIAGRGNRTGGTLIGAGVGAIAGLAIDKAEDKNRPSRPYPVPQGGIDDGYDYGYADDRVTGPGGYPGGYEGEWDGPDGARYPEPDDRDPPHDDRDHRGADDGSHHGPGHAPGAHGGGGPHGYGPQVIHGGYYANGYYYPAPVITTVIIHPAVTTTTTYIEEEVIYAAPKKKVWKAKAKKVWRPKAKPRCVCR